MGANSLNGSFEILGIMGKGLPDFQVCVLDSTANCIGAPVVSDRAGITSLEFENNSNFIVRGQNRRKYQDLYIVGNSGDAGFRYPTYMGTRFEAKALATLMRRPYNASLGTVVVGMDVQVGEELQPAVGASAFVKGISGDSPFILYDNFIPKTGQAVIPRGSSFVTWTNMEPDVTGAVEVIPPKGMQCFVSPGISSKLEAFPFSVYMDAVTVISFICENATVDAISI